MHTAVAILNDRAFCFMSKQNYLYIFFHYLNPDKRGGRERTILKIRCPLHTDVTSMRPVYARNVTVHYDTNRGTGLTNSVVLLDETEVTYFQHLCYELKLSCIVCDVYVGGNWPTHLANFLIQLLPCKPKGFVLAVVAKKCFYFI